MQTNINNSNNHHSSNNFNPGPLISRLKPTSNEKELAIGGAVRPAFLSQEYPLPAIITEEEISSHSILECSPEKSLQIKHEFMRLINSTKEEIRKNEILSIGANFLAPGLITGNNSKDFALDGFTPERNYKIWGWLLDDLLKDLNPRSDEYEVVQKLKMGINQLEQYAHELEELKGVSDPVALHEMALRYATNAAKLSPGQSLLFHGGWRNKAGGSSHAQVFELTKRKHGTYDLNVYQSTQDILANVWLAGNKQRVSPKIVFKGIPENVLLFNEDGVIRPGFIQSLIELRALAEKDLNRVVDDNEVMRIFSYLQKYYQTPSLNDGGAITGQRSGSCVPSATKAWIREKCGDQQLYKDVLFYLKMKLNIVLYHGLKEKLPTQTIDGEIGRRLFKMTAWNLMRNMGKANHQPAETSLIASLWPVQKANATLHHLVKNIEMIEEDIAAEKREHTCPSQISSLDPNQQRINRAGIKPDENEKNAAKSFNVSHIPRLVPKLDVASNRGIDDLIRLLEKTTDQNDHLQDYSGSNERSICVQIHQMIDQIPLPGKKGNQFWESINQYQPKQRVEKLTQIHSLLQTILEQYAYTIQNDPLTRRFATVFAIHALSRFISIEIEKARTLNPDDCLLPRYSTQNFEEVLQIEGLIFFDANEKKRIKEAVDYLKESSRASPKAIPLFVDERGSTIIKTQVKQSPTNGRFWQDLLNHNIELRDAVDREANRRWPDLTDSEIDEDYNKKREEYLNSLEQLAKYEENAKRSQNPGFPPSVGDPPKKLENLPQDTKRTMILENLGWEGSFLKRQGFDHIHRLRLTTFLSRQLLNGNTNFIKRLTRNVYRESAYNAVGYVDSHLMAAQFEEFDVKALTAELDRERRSLDAEHQNLLGFDVANRAQEKWQQPTAEVNTLKEFDPEKGNLGRRLLRSLSEWKLSPSQLMYEIKEFKELENPSFQEMFFRLFFRSPIFEDSVKVGAGKLMTKDPALYTNAFDFINRGLAYARTADQPEGILLFFLEFSFHLSKYLVDQEADGANAFNQLEEIKRWKTEQSLSKKLSREAQSKLNLIGVLFGTLNSPRSQFEPINEAADPEEIAKTCAFWVLHEMCPSNNSSWKSPRLYTTAQMAMLKLASRLEPMKDNPEWIHQFGQAFFSKLDIDSTHNGKWQVADSGFPCLFSEPYLVDLALGAVYGPKGKFNIPNSKEWEDSPDFIRLFKDTQTQKIPQFNYKSDGSNVQFDWQEKGIYQVDVKKNKIRRRFAGQSTWFTYYNPNTLSDYQIPAALTYDHVFWRAPKKCGYLGVFTDLTTKEITHYLLNDGTIREAEIHSGEQAGKNGYLLDYLDDSKNSTKINGITQFENKENITCYQNSNGSTERIVFTRYRSTDGNPLMFIMKGGKFVWSENQEYALPENKPLNLLGTIPNYLYLESVRNPQKGIVIVPFRPIIINEIQKDSLPIAQGMLEINSIGSLIPKSENQKEFSGTQRYFAYEFNSEKFKETSLESRLFLAYIYFSQKENEKCIELLKGVKSTDKLSPIAMTVLDLIMGFDPGEDHPEAKSVYMHALYLKLKEKERLAVTAPDFFPSGDLDKLKRSFVYFADILGSLNNISHPCRMGVEEEKFLLTVISSEFSKLSKDPSYNTYQETYLEQIKERLRFLETSTPSAEVKMIVTGKIELPPLKMSTELGVFKKLFKPRSLGEKSFCYRTQQDYYLKIKTNPEGFFDLWSFEESNNNYLKHLNKYNLEIKKEMRHFNPPKRVDLDALFYTRPNVNLFDNDEEYFTLLSTVHDCATSGLKAQQEELLYRLLLWKQTIPDIPALQSQKIDFLICDLAHSLQLIDFQIYEKKLTLKELANLSDEEKYAYWQTLQEAYTQFSSSLEKLGYAELFKSIKELPKTQAKRSSTKSNYPIPLISPLEPIKQTPESVSNEAILPPFSPAPEAERWNKLKLWSSEFMEDVGAIGEKEGEADFTFPSDPLPENILKNSEENFSSSLKEDFKLLQEDYDMGKQLNQTTQQTISDENCKLLKKNTAEWAAQLEQEIAEKEKSLLLLANKLEEDPLKKQLHLARLGGKTEKQIDFQDCLNRLLSGDGRNLMILNSNLTAEDIQTISSQTLEIVDLKSALAQAKRVIGISSEIESSANQPAARRYHCQRLSAELNSSYDFSRFENSVQIALRVFAGQTGMIPFPKQLNMIEKMLEKEESQPDQFKDIVIQLIMGGGKTSVIATIILYLAAKRKGRCAVFIVPQALLETVKTNLAESMMQAFQVKTEAISLSREEFTPFKLDQTYQLLKKVQNEEIVVVVDGITLQALELEVRSLACKMKELILEKKRLNKELKSRINVNINSAKKEQINLLNQELSQIREKTVKIVNILRLAQNSFDGLIDEVDLILDCYQELNFVDGDKVQIDPSINHLLLTIAKALVSDKIFIHFDNGKKSSLKEYVKLYTNQQSLLSTENFQSYVAPVLAAHLFENMPEINDYLGNLQGSFIRFVNDRISTQTKSLMSHQGAITKEVLQGFSDLKDLSPEIVQEDIKFLELFETLKQGDENQKEAAKLISETKHFFVDLLPFTLTKIGGRNYGPTKEGKVIPFLGVNTPSQTEFGYHWEAAWYHYGWGASSKPSKEVIQFVTEQYQASAVYYSQKYEEAFEDTAEYQEFFHLFGVRLDEMHIAGNLELAIENLSKDLDKVLELQFDLIMKFVTYTPRRLSSNGFNLLDLLSSRRTMSATPWNVQGYGEKLTKRLENDLGTEGRILHQLAKKMQDKDPLEIDFRDKNRVVPFTFSDFIEQVYAKKVDEGNSFKQVRGIIEAGGLFKTFGFNADVAKEWMEFLHKKQNNEDEKIRNGAMKEEDRTVDPNIEGVLFFHTDPGHRQPNTLYVWKKGSLAPERLGSSSPASLAAKGLIPANYVVYYDERHTTGVDILQAPEAVNLMTFDEKMLIRTKTQGLMRMRQFLFEQGVEMVVSKKTRKSLYQSGKSVKDLVLNAAKVQSLRKPQMMYRYFLQQIINVFVKNSVELVFQGLEIPMDDEKFAEIVEKGEKFFVTQLVDDPIVQHGSLAGFGNTKEMLKGILQQKWKKFQEAFQHASILNPVADEVKALESWIDQAKCLSENWKTPAEAMGVEQEVEIRVENNVEISMENEIEKDLEQELKRLEEGMPATPIGEPVLSFDDFTAYIQSMKENPVESKKNPIIPLHDKFLTSTFQVKNRR